jgi:DNA invertase Pin-like site-specific DNA recombinase
MARIEGNQIGAKASEAMRAAVYARVSTTEQTVDNQLLELRRYAESRGWTAKEYVDVGVSGAKDRRPALDAMLSDAKRRRFDVVVVWRLDRLGRNLKHLITLLEELQALGIAFVSLAEGIDATTPAGKLQMHILGAIAEFERGRIRERVVAGLQRARTQGKRLGRPRVRPALVDAPGGTIRAAARFWGVSKTTAARWIADGRECATRRETETPLNTT